jgi:hypothetical protein
LAYDFLMGNGEDRVYPWGGEVFKTAGDVQANTGEIVSKQIAGYVLGGGTQGSLPEGKVASCTISYDKSALMTINDAQVYWRGTWSATDPDENNQVTVTVDADYWIQDKSDPNPAFITDKILSFFEANGLAKTFNWRSTSWHSTSTWIVTVGQTPAVHDTGWPKITIKK